MKLYKYYFPKNNFTRVLIKYESIVRQNFLKYNMMYSAKLIDKNRLSMNSLKSPILFNKFKKAKLYKKDSQRKVGPSIS